jgi:hypothetical protein
MITFMASSHQRSDPRSEQRTALPNRDRAISLAALRLHAQGLLASFEAGHAGFVSDRYLATFGPDTAPAVLELCLAGVWARVGAGYEVVSSEALRMAHEVHRQMRGSRSRDC